MATTIHSPTNPSPSPSQNPLTLTIPHRTTYTPRHTSLALSFPLTPAYLSLPSPSSSPIIRLIPRRNPNPIPNYNPTLPSPASPLPLSTLPFPPLTLFATLEALAQSLTPNQALIHTLWRMQQELERRGVVGYARLVAWMRRYKREVRSVRAGSLRREAQRPGSVSGGGNGATELLGKAGYKRYGAGCMVLRDGWRFRDSGRAWFEVVEGVEGEMEMEIGKVGGEKNRLGEEKGSEKMDNESVSRKEKVREKDKAMDHGIYNEKVVWGDSRMSSLEMLELFV